MNIDAGRFSPSLPFFRFQLPRSARKQSSPIEFLIGLFYKSDHVDVVITYIHARTIRLFAPLYLVPHRMLPTRICSRCSRLLNHGSISIWPHRFASTSYEPPSISIPEENLAVNDDLDRNVSRLPDDVYRHFKGRSIECHLVSV